MTKRGTGAALRKLPLLAFAALVVATVAALFITQHLKVTTPLISAVSPPTAPAIVPDGRSTGCPDSTSISFYLLHEADDVNVYVVNARGEVVRALATGLSMGRKQRAVFTWSGRTDGGPADAGEYHFRVVLVRQRRTIDPVIVGATGSAATVRVRASCSAT